MTITTNERDLVEQAAKHRSAIAVAQTALEVVANERKAIRRAAELELRNASKEALVKAQRDLDEKAQALDAAERNEQSLTLRLDAGDASVSIEDRKDAALAVDSAQRLYKSAQAALTAPNREFAIDSSDSLIAERAVEILSVNAERLGLEGFDIVSFTRPEMYEPAVLPTLVLSQTATSGNYGTALLNGSTSLTFFMADGEKAPTLDPKVLDEVFEENRCDVTLHRDVLRFNRCVYDVPMLLNGPDVRVLHSWGLDMAGILKEGVKKHALEAGVRINLDTRESWDGNGYASFEDPVQITRSTFEIDGGNAVGHLDLQVNTESDSAHIQAALERVVKQTKDYLIDIPTDMGIVGKVSATVRKVPVTYTETDNYSIYGSRHRIASKPSWIIQYELHTKFEPMAAVID